MTILQSGLCGPYELFTIDKGTEKLESHGMCGVIMRSGRLVGSYAWDCREEWDKVRTVSDLEGWIAESEASKTNWRD